jgi:hypothetical protein
VDPAAVASARVDPFNEAMVPEGPRPAPEGVEPGPVAGAAAGAVVVVVVVPAWAASELVPAELPPHPASSTAPAATPMTLARANAREDRTSSWRVGTGFGAWGCELS